MAKLGLQLHPTKTRLIEFGRRSAGRNRRDGRKSETFDFLGLTHFCVDTNTQREEEAATDAVFLLARNAIGTADFIRATASAVPSADFRERA